jgi:hypothetical protein
MMSYRESKVRFDKCILNRWYEFLPSDSKFEGKVKWGIKEEEGWEEI